MQITSELDVPVLTEALFLHVIGYLNSHFSNALGDDYFEVKTIDVVKDSSAPKSDLCLFQVDKSLSGNYVITMWYRGFKATVNTTKRNGTDAKIIKFLSAFPDVKEYHH